MAAPMVCRIRARSMRGRAGTARSMSSRVIAPSGPVPVTRAGSTPSSSASRLAAGEIRRRAGTGAAGGGGATGTPASSRIRASTVPVGTVAPGWTRIFSITPPTKTSTSMSPLSVSTSAMISPRFTVSPGCFRQTISVPAVMSAPRIGITNSTTAAEHLLDRGNDGRRLRQRGVLHVLRVRHRDLGAADARHRPVEVVEAALHDPRAHLPGAAAPPPPLLHDHGAVGPGDRGEDARGVEGTERAQVDDLGLDPLHGEPVGGLQRLAERAPVGDEGEGVPRPADLGAADL